MLLPVRREWGWVHMGFARATEALWDSIESTLRECVSSNRELYFTGHSLGGAMAVIAALKAHFELDMTIAGIATFGQPPLAGTSTLESIKKAGLEDYPRIVNSVDVVVTGPFLPFYHAGSLRYFDSNGLLHQEFSWPRFFIDAARDGWHWRVAGQVKRHFMDGYVSLVASQLARTRRA